jgi:predicted dehydrogenase
MAETLRVGLIGCGDYGQVHARVYANDPRTRLVALWSPHEARRLENARRFGCRAASDWREIVEDPRLDCVSVATPDDLHAEYAIAALSAGKHVLVEKPMAMTVAECEAMLAARDAGKGKLMVNYHNRWYPAFAEARRAIRAGEIGSPVSANFVLSNTISWVLGSMKWGNRSGPEWFLMSHIADLAFWLLDDVPASVFAAAAEGVLKSKGIATRDVVKATLVMRGGAIVHLESSWIVPPTWRNPVNEMWLSVQGASGRVDVSADQENITFAAREYRTPFVLLSLTEEPPIRDFITCVLSGGPVPVTGEEGLLVTRAIDAIIRSYTQKSTIAVDWRGAEP